MVWTSSFILKFQAVKDSLKSKGANDRLTALLKGSSVEAEDSTKPFCADSKNNYLEIKESGNEGTYKCYIYYKYIEFAFKVC